ncbi:hypothetical protein DFP74_3828 [Nocardiopsis sp. Huas11]|uniref:hypothetical protein n=1 Tax=Nocardiopsis sp. Huas11 TaxID=2183912 RepID=UPI000F24357A|nr:hypothetical protein [Nocardiopsis sp. Huas11]RKS08135.1 hypothetical protein DFP74_3828 [Nocardiopsis sp. Huas11]
MPKKKPRRRPERGKGANDIHRGPTRDPGSTGAVGCYIILVAVVAIGLMILLFELLG